MGPSQVLPLSIRSDLVVMAMKVSSTLPRCSLVSYLRNPFFGDLIPFQGIQSGYSQPHPQGVRKTSFLRDFLCK